MKWTKEAEDAVARVPFFVRKRVRSRIEAEAAIHGSREITIEHVGICQKRYLNNMEEEVAGFQIETCFGPSGCPNRVVDDEGIAVQVENLLKKKNLRNFFKLKVKGPLKIHHEFKVSISDCPNACSRPQIADIGLIGACRPSVTNDPCSGCRACVEACREDAIELTAGPVMDYGKCLSCGNCCKVCPSGTLVQGRQGWRIMIGGKLGRHPRLGSELEGIFSSEEALVLFEKCIDIYTAHTVEGERFGEVIDSIGMKMFTALDLSQGRNELSDIT
ncbi:MAG TPA: 4Fe-4S dicluster domain-containing protein [Dissulfurispiraceae bacterium]|nr:4Fe-4S dicluster domain-containing protein [Dissulfurispiraceae bacterium]